MIFKRKKTINKILIVVISLFLCGIKVEAACSYIDKANLNDQASKITTNYEVIEKKSQIEFVDPDTGEVSMREHINPSFKISIYNLSKDLYVVTNNSLTKEDKTIFYENGTNGVYSFETEDTVNIIKYTYNIYSNMEGCSGEILKSYSFTKPKINMYSQYSVCEGKEDIPYCQRYITEEIDVSESELLRKIQEYQKTDEPTTEVSNQTGIKDVIENNYKNIILGVVLVTGAIVTTVLIVKKRSTI
ncbi:MAG: hypothetical protein PHF21_04995 [Bacilli bacterium]|nr:hypothetical protein [Bacilli bacterium]